MQMNRIKTIIGILLIFACGAAAGAGGMRFYVTQQVEQFATAGPPVTKLLIRPDIVRELELTDVQQEKIANIQARIEADIQAFKQAHHPELAGIIENGFAEINELLDPDQQVRFARIHKSIKHRLEKGRHSHGKRPFRIPRMLCVVELSRRLDLSTEQIENIRPILNTYIEKYRQDIHGTQDRPRRSFQHSGIRAVEQEAIKRIQPFLNPAQRAILASMISEHAFINQPEKEDDP